MSLWPIIAAASEQTHQPNLWPDPPTKPDHSLNNCTCTGHRAPVWEPISFIILQLFVLSTTECVQRQFAKKKISSILFVLWPHLFVLWSHCGGYGELLSLHLVHCTYCGQSGQSSRFWPKKGISHVSESISAQSQYTKHTVECTHVFTLRWP